MPADIIDLTQSPAIRAPTQAKPRNDAEDTLLTRALNEVSHKLLLTAVLKLAAAQPLAAQDLEDLLFALEEDYKNYNTFPRTKRRKRKKIMKTRTKTMITARRVMMIPTPVQTRANIRETSVDNSL